jgi:photosynthetic reaction center cytochrome c subunit
MMRRDASPFKGALSMGAALAALSLVFLSTATSLAAPAAPQEATAQPKTAAEVFKNIQVLKDIPASELIPAMRYITTSLGVGCEFCHDQKHFDSDDKAEKKTARRMMQMMFAINQDTFKGKREVTCYTCHAGSKKPITTPGLPAEGATPAVASSAGGGRIPAGETDEREPGEGATSEQAAAQGNWPTAEEIVAKYVQAIGGERALERVKTLAEGGTLEISARNINAKVEVDRKAPDKAITAVEMPHGITAHGFDGRVGWAQRGNDADPILGSELVQEKRWAAFYPGADISTYYTRLQVDGVETIDGQDVYRVSGWPAGAPPEKLYFDQKTGLLVRVTSLIPSPLGALPKETDYADYRGVHGIKVPGTIRIVELSGISTFRFDSIEANKPIDDSRFAMPVPQPGEK